MDSKVKNKYNEGTNLNDATLLPIRTRPMLPRNLLRKSLGLAAPIRKGLLDQPEHWQSAYPY